MPSLPPPSPEVITESILRGVEENGVERDMPCVREIAACFAHEMAALWQAIGADE